MPMEMEFYLVIKHGSLGIAPTLLKLDLWSTGWVFISFFLQIPEDGCNYLWVQFRVGAIPCLPYEQGRKRPLDTPKRMIERRERERKVEGELKRRRER